MEYGYARVSSTDQNADRQIIALKSKGIEESNIYMDKISGATFDRPMYKRMFRKLKQGDVVYIVSIDRLGRDYEEIQDQWRLITKKKKADIVVIDMPLLDTRTGKDLMGAFLSDIVLQVLSFAAENERRCIKERQADGIAAAKARGVKFGRPGKPIPDNFNEIAEMVINKEISMRCGARICNLPPSTFSKHLKKYLIELGKNKQS